MTLHLFQQDVLDRLRATYADGKRTALLQMATGSGKTHTAAECIRLAVARGNKVVFAAHLDSLITDTSARLTSHGVEHGIVQADRPSNPTAPVQVASLATLHRRQTRPPADLLILDECRRAAAPTVKAVLEAYQSARLLGLDATPERADGTPLGDIFDEMICGPSVKWLTQQGYLVPAHVFSPPMTLAGSIAMDPVDAYVKHAYGLKTIFFCRDVETAYDVAARLPVPAKVITGETPRSTREAARRGIANGDLLAIVNVNVYRDGADLPSLECAVLAQTLGVTSAFLQACGRVLRPSPGKTHALVLDLSGAAILHGLPEDDREWSLTGDAVKRTGDDLKIVLARCNQCFAVFHAGPTHCPRCADRLLRSSKLQRRATRIERQELSKLNDRPQHVRDRIALEGIAKRLRASGRFSEAQIPHIAASIFRKNQKRSPVAGAA